MKIQNYITFIVSGLLSAGVVLICRELLDYSAFVADTGSWGVFFTVFGVLYAIMLGFLLIESLEKFNGLSTILDSELNELQDIRDALIYLDNPDSIEDNISKKVQGYAQAVLDKEWQQLALLGSTMGSDTSGELYDLMHAVHDIEPINKSDEEVQKMLMNKTFNITTLRTQRINLSNQTLPPRLLALILFMSAVLVIGFILMAIENVWFHVFMVSTLTMSVHVLYQVMKDLDSPFEGVWNIETTDFEQFVSKK